MGVPNGSVRKAFPFGLPYKRHRRLLDSINVLRPALSSRGLFLAYAINQVERVKRKDKHFFQFLIIFAYKSSKSVNF